MTEPEARSFEQTADLLRQARTRLLSAGYQHANEAGELVSQDGTTWVGTTYVHGEYSLYAWRRPRGHGEVAEVRSVLRIGRTTDEAVLDAVIKRLSTFAKKPRKDHIWPPRGMGLVR